MTMTPLQQPHDLADLARVSARIGADPLLIQAAGGNTSVKQNGVLWIKASGMLLADALARNVFVPADLTAMQASLAAGEERADRPAEFALAGDLRPSIETSLHAVFPQRVVVHVHCVSTIAHAIRADACDVLTPLLADFDWAMVPYARPGADLARSVAAARGPETNVMVLGNHGLIVAAETVAEADALLSRVVRCLNIEPDVFPKVDTTELTALSDADYTVPDASHPLHGVALEPHRLAAAMGGSLYPDHIIFCGPSSVALGAGERPENAVARRVAQGLPPPPYILLPGQGVLIRRDASAGALALTQCLGDVLMRTAPDAPLVTLTPADEASLMNWDAEKYRQSLNAEAR